MTIATPVHDEPEEELRFEKITEPRDGYFVDYLPYAAYSKSAQIHLVFTSKTDVATVRASMERELHHWVKRYSIQTMVSAFDDTGSVISLGDSIEDNHLVGWPDRASGSIVGSWKLSDLSEYQKLNPHPPNLRELYKGVPFRTGTQIKSEGEASINKIAREVRYMRAMLIIWLVVVPAGVAIIEYFAPDWLSLLVLAYSLWQAHLQWRKVMGYRKSTKAEMEAQEKDTKMRLYYFHCERNPEGFLRLKLENFEREAREQTLAEAARIAARES